VKNGIKYILQRGLGFQRYLYVFALFKIKTLHNDKKEKDFFHFLSLLKDGQGSVLDIGANLGIMTFYLSKKLPKSKIIAFEPIKDNLIVLKRVVSKFKLKNVQIHELALGEEQGKVEMVLPHQKGTKMQGLSHVKHESITEWNEGDSYTVDIDTLDNILPQEKIQGIKIDVENFEYYVLRGGKQIIESNKPIIYAELWDNSNRIQCFELLNEIGYSINVIVENVLTKFDSKVHDHQNFIFLPN